MIVLYRTFVLIGLLVLLSAQRVLRREDYDTTEQPEIKSPDWMVYLEPDRSLADLSIPGSHLSTAVSGGSPNQRQSWSLYRQYEAGIRYVDIRCRHHQNQLYVYQGRGSTRRTLDDIMRETIRFLNAYPSETILLRLRREQVPVYNRETMGETVKRLFFNYPSYRIWSSTRVPAVHEARGKIVILQDFYGPHQVGLHYRYLTIEDSGNVRNQHAFNWKWERVRHHLYAAQQGDKDTMYLTHTAGTGPGVIPYAAASRLNRRVWDFMKQWEDRQNRWGIIAMDFPGAQLVKLIIDSNF